MRNRLFNSCMDQSNWPLLKRLLEGELLAITESYFNSFKASGIVAVSLVSRSEIFKLNQKYRKRARATDILSFPSTLSRSEHLNSVKEAYLNDLIYKRKQNISIQLGHLILCPEILKRRLTGPSFSSWTLKYRIQRLLIHGFAHLCNLDHHHTREQVEEMLKFEKEMILKLN